MHRGSTLIAGPGMPVRPLIYDDNGITGSD